MENEKKHGDRRETAGIGKNTRHTEALRHRQPRGEEETRKEEKSGRVRELRKGKRKSTRLHGAHQWQT